MRMIGRAWLACAVAAVGVAAGAAYAAGMYTVDTGTVAIQGAQKKVLTDEHGRTLYYFTADTPTKSACTGGCAKVWPPLLSTSAPTSEGTLPGKLTLVSDANGSQVAYNGHLLYTYAGDSAAGQAAGQGKFGKWWVATVDLAAAAPASSPTVKQGGYGGYNNTGSSSSNDSGW